MSVPIERLVDATYGPRLYHGGERFRDGDPGVLKTARLCTPKGVNEKLACNASRLFAVGAHNPSRSPSGIANDS